MTVVPDGVLAFTRLLSTSKQVRDEVAPIAYGVVTFRLASSGAVVDWFRTLGFMQRHIRHVGVHRIARSRIRPLFHQLKCAANVDTITLNAPVRRHPCGRPGRGS